MRHRVAILAILLLVGLTTVTPAQAEQAQRGIVSADPVDWTPHVLNGTVYAFAVIGQTVIVGGDFTTVRETSGLTYARTNLFAFTLGTGRVLPTFAPWVDAPVRALAAGANRTVYAGGDFTQVNDEWRAGIVHLGLEGNILETFDTSLDRKGIVRSLARYGNQLYVGGQFTSLGGVKRAALARLDATTGLVDLGFDMRLETDGGRQLWVQSLAISEDGDMLAFDGTFTRVADVPRFQLALVRVSDGTPRLSSWSTTVYADSQCSPEYQTYLRGLDFSPDGSYIVVVTTGHDASQLLMCDTAARFNTSGGGGQRPVWVNRTGGNTLLSVAITGPAVYVGGHQQWLDNPLGVKSAGPGAVPRPGIGAIDPETGKALSWNPTKERGVGTEALVAYPGGLLVGSDTEEIGHEYHPRVAIFPLNP